MAIKEDRPAGIKEIASALGLCERTIRRYHADGKLPTFTCRIMRTRRTMQGYSGAFLVKAWKVSWHG